MKFVYGRNRWKNMDIAENDSYLLTNGLGGFSSLSIVGSNARNDHGLLIGAHVAPNDRIHMLTNVWETLFIDQCKYELYSQRFVTETENKTGFSYLDCFEMNDVPVWTYQVNGVEIKKTIVMPHKKNMICLYYEIKHIYGEDHHIKLHVEPLMRQAKKDAMMHGEGEPSIEKYPISMMTNGEITPIDTKWSDAMYFAKDACDGRKAMNYSFTNHVIDFSATKGVTSFYLFYAMDQVLVSEEIDPWSYIDAEKIRLKSIVEQSELTSELGRYLVKAADAYIVQRESTGNQSIIAGYPFFGDWGRDTMIAMLGCTITAKRYEDAKSIFRSFMRYCKKGLMPNLFPEGENEPLYNTADASLLFINAVYSYIQESKDMAFIMEAWPVINDIIGWYIKGTDYNIHMDEDGLIIAGTGLWQVTWMDVRFNDILPTPRHGKPVEINAYWYSALRVAAYFSDLLNIKNGNDYAFLADKVKESFNKQFWNEEKQCLKDVISGTCSDTQIRCNQIWALSQPFLVLDEDRAIKVLYSVYNHLYTAYGLRSLSSEDKEFKALYGGNQFYRDMAYHQGTVWVFPVGAFFRAWLQHTTNKKHACKQVEAWLQILSTALEEGCIGQLPEIYDGLNPYESKGCFAQAWSVGEILSVCKMLEQMKEENGIKNEF